MPPQKMHNCHTPLLMRICPSCHLRPQTMKPNNFLNAEKAEISCRASHDAGYSRLDGANLCSKSGLL